MGICGLDGRSRAPRDGFMASHIIDTKQLRVAKLSFDGNQVRKYAVPGSLSPTQKSISTGRTPPALHLQSYTA